MLTACMVLYHSGEAALAAAACFCHADLPVRLHIVDNSPDDGLGNRLKQACPGAVLHIPGQNLGYGRGNNLVLPLTESDYHLILNPDIRFDASLLSDMTAWMDAHPDVGALTPRLLNTDGTEQFVPRREPTVRRLLGGRIPGMGKYRDEYTMRNEPLAGPVDCEFASGSFLLIRSGLFQALGGFDPRFFLYHEDSDLSRRILQRSRIVYHPGFCVTHGWQRESARRLRPLLMHIRSTVQYFAKWGWKW